MNLKYFLLSLIFLISCGNVSSESSHEVIPAIPLVSEFQGLLFTGVQSSPQTAVASELFFYDFQSGKIHLVASGLARNPAVFLISPQRFAYFSREEETKFSLLKMPFQDTKELENIPIEGLLGGDPWSLVGIPDNEDLALLASPHSRALHIFDVNIGEVITTFTDADLPTDNEVIPTHLWKLGGEIFVLNSGYTEPFNSSLSRTNPGIYKLKLNSDGMSLISAEFNSLETVSFPTRAKVINGETFAVGLCPQGTISCTPGWESLGNPNKSKDIGSLNLNFINEQIAISEEKVAFAQVSGLEFEGFQLFQISFEDDSVIGTKLHAYETSKTTALIHDPTQNRLFIGDTIDNQGSLLIFDGPKLVDRISLPATPFNGVLVP